MLRRSLIIGSLSAAAGRASFAASPLTKGRGGGTIASGGGGFSPDGTHLYGALGGGANTSLGAASLVMPYGTFTMGDFGGPEPHSAGGLGKMCQILLNGTPIAPGYLLGEGNPPWFAELQVANGGNVYGCHLNQIWYEFRGWCWAGNNGLDYASGPALMTPPIPAMVRNPPYTPSADGTTITAPTSSTVTTAEGIWGFGSSHGASGYALQLNGVDVGWSNIQNFIGVDIIKVCGYGQLAYHYPDNGSWYTWCLRQPNQTGSGGGIPPANNVPIPVDIRLNPLRPDDPSPPRPTDTFVSAVTVTMSNGSAFAGAYGAITGQGFWNLKFAGNNLVVDTPDTPGAYNYFIPKINAGQNNCGLDTYFSYATLP